MIILNNLTYVYRKGAEALSNASASIGGGIYLLLGENGAGKTTLLHVIAGLLHPAGGECLIDGEPTSGRKPEIMRRVFFLGDNMSFPFVSIEEMTRCHAVFYPTFDAEMLNRNLQRFGMTGEERLDKLSLGNRHKAQLAYALALRTEVLLFDEPANGLDIPSRQQLQTMIAECVEPRQTVIISTHIVSDLRNLYDGVLVLSRGKLLLADTTDSLLGRVSFTVTTVPPVSPLYMERRLNSFHAILPAGDSDESGDVDYELLFNALRNNVKL